MTSLDVPLCQCPRCLQEGEHPERALHQQMNLLLSRLDEARLQSIAEQGGGRYWRFDADATAREVGDAIRAIAVAGDTVEAGVSPEDRYQLFLAVAVLALFAEWLLDERRRMPDQDHNVHAERTRQPVGGKERGRIFFKTKNGFDRFVYRF